MEDFVGLGGDDFGHDVDGGFGVGVLILVLDGDVVFGVDFGFGGGDFEELVAGDVGLEGEGFFLHANSNKLNQLAPIDCIVNHNLNILFSLLLSKVHGTYSDFYNNIFSVSSPISSDFNVITCIFSMFGDNSSKNTFSNFVFSKSEPFPPSRLSSPTGEVIV